MIIDLPDTSTGAIGQRLVRLRNENGAMALGRVLTLVIVVDEDRAESAIASANEASYMHPCRIIAVVRGNRRGARRLDGQIRVGGDAGAAEVVVARLYGELVHHGAAVVAPLLLPDSPIVGWWPNVAPNDTSDDQIGTMCQRRITDAAVATNTLTEIKRRGANYAPGDTDLAWSRITRWRGVLAAALDQAPFDPPTGGVVTGGVDSPSTDLLAAWLADRLRISPVRARTPRGTGLISVKLERVSGNLELVRPLGTSIATLTHPLQPERRIAMVRRSDAECLADELRHLDPDEIYHATLAKGLRRIIQRTAPRGAVLRAHAD